MYVPNISKLVQLYVVIFDPFLAKLAAAENAHFGPKIQSQPNPTKISD